MLVLQTEASHPPVRAAGQSIRGRDDENDAQENTGRSGYTAPQTTGNGFKSRRLRRAAFYGPKKYCGL